jgi:hypothetical protein
MGEGPKLLIALIVAIVVSFLSAWLILRSVFRHEEPKRLVPASVLAIMYPYAVLLLYAVVYATFPLGEFDLWDVRSYMLIVLACASTGLIVILRLIVSRGNRPTFEGYNRAVVLAAVVIGICIVTWGHQKVNTAQFGDSFAYATPVVTVVSFLLALLTSRSLFRAEGSAKAVFAAVLIAQFACTVPPLLAVVYDAPVSHGGLPYPMWRWTGETLFFLLFVFFPAVFLPLLWLVAFVRHSFQSERSYEWEAKTALLIGACSVLWNAHFAWSTLEKL